MSADRDNRAERVYLELVRSHQTAILNYVYRLVGDIDVAEDLTQDTYLKAYRALGGLDLADEAAPLRRAWLYRIAHNTATDYLRRRARLRWVRLEALRLSAEADPATDYGRREQVRRALAALANEHRAVLLLFNHAGLSAGEVGEVLGISPEAARKRRQRAREAFAKAYGSPAADRRRRARDEQ